jgi:hypothetical protein
MRKLKTVLLSAILLAGAASGAGAQAAVTAPILEATMTLIRADQITYYAQSIAKLVESATTAYNQFQNMLRMEEMAINNLQGVRDIRSWDDFMSWYNRQLYLERQAEEKFLGIGIDVAGETYRVADILEIPDALLDEYLDWETEFPEDKRRETWLNMGLSPANYTYTQAWRAREKKMLESVFTKPEVINVDNMTVAERHAALMEALKNDQNKPDEEKMGEKALLTYMLEVQMDIDKALREANYDRAKAEELAAVQRLKNETPANPPGLSEMYNKELFTPLE